MGGRQADGCLVKAAARSVCAWIVQQGNTAMQAYCPLLRHPNSGTHFEMRNGPMLIHAVAVEPSSQLVPHAARRHALQRERGHLQGLGCSSKGR